MRSPAPLSARPATPRSEVVQLSGRHYAPFLKSHEQAVEAEISFLQKHLPSRDHR